MLDRRHFIAATAAASTGAAMGIRPTVSHADHHGSHGGSHGGDGPLKISLAQWSLHRTLRDASKNISNLDFPRVTKEAFGIEAVEYVNQFFMDKARDRKYLRTLKQNCDDHGVKSLLIMVDREGDLGNADETKRSTAVENHLKWLEAAEFLGCHSIRVNARSSGSYEEQVERAADGLRRVCEMAAPMGLNVLVENHGGLSSNGAWLAETIRKTGMANCGTLPDFGNFYIRRGDNPEEYDRYQGVDELMPFAKAVSAKTHDFDDDGNETETDYQRMIGLVLDHNYRGYVGIEYEGNRSDEYAGIRATKTLLDRVIAEAVA